MSDARRLVHLPPIGVGGGADVAAYGDVADHPMRRVTESVVSEPASWTAAERREVARFFDELAPDWDERHRTSSVSILADAWERGEVPEATRVLELGSGTGRHSTWLAERAAQVLCVDVAWEMVRRAPAGPGHRLLADGACLPFPSAAIDVAVLLNAFLFPAELRRIVRPGGVVVWASSRGAGTPIYLSPDRVLGALGAEWSAITSQVEGGSWVVARHDSGPAGAALRG